MTQIVNARLKGSTKSLRTIPPVIALLVAARSGFHVSKNLACICCAFAALLQTLLNFTHIELRLLCW